MSASIDLPVFSLPTVGCPLENLLLMWTICMHMSVGLNSLLKSVSFAI